MAKLFIHLEPTVLRQLELIQREEGKPFDRVVSELLTEALGRRKGTSQAAQLDWISKPMGARFDLSDKERLFTALDRKLPQGRVVGVRTDFEGEGEKRATRRWNPAEREKIEENLEEIESASWD